MQKLCSNGGHFQTLFSLHLKRLVLYSTSSASSEATSSMVDFMVNSLGFSREEAGTAWNKVRPSKTRNPERPELVVNFLKQRGLDDAQIKKIVSSVPNLLRSKVDRTLEPKFNAFEELGVHGSDLAHIIASNPSILARGLETRIAPMVSFLKSFLGNQNFIKVLRGKSYWLMSRDVAAVLQPNMELLRKYGISNERIQKLLNDSIFWLDPKRLEGILVKVEEELGIPRSSCVFPDAIIILCQLSEKTRESKRQLFMSFGMTDSDFNTMVRKFPRCLLLSETKMRRRLNFFVNELGCEPRYLASRPYVLTYSFDKRVLPRYTILKVLKERKLIRADPGILNAVCTSEPRFLEKYVLPYKDELPELCEAYICRKKESSSVEAASKTRSA